MTGEPFHLDFAIDPDELRRIAQGQRELLLSIADRIAQGLPLDDLSVPERQMVAAVIRLGAARIPDEAPRHQGPKPKLDASAVALEYVAMIRDPRHPVSAFKAMGKLAEKYDVSFEAIRKAIEKKGADAEALADWAAGIHTNQKK